MLRVIVACLLGILAAPGPAWAAEPSPRPESSDRRTLTLDEAIRTGLARHPLIERTRYRSQLAKALTKQVQGALHPWLEASVAGSSGSLRIVTSDGKVVHDRGGHGFDPGGALPKHNQNMVTGGLLLNQLITDFGHTAHRILASRAAEAASEKEILTNKALVILNVQRAYVNCLLQQNLVEIAEETLTRRKAVRDQVEALYKAQLRPKVDLDLILVEVANAELVLIKARNALQQAFAELNNAMGVEGPARYELEELPIAVAALPTLERLVEAGLKDRPELLGQQDRLAASEELRKATRALHFGSISAVGTIGITKYWDVHEGGIRDNQLAPLWGVGATAQVPLFTGFRIRSQIAESDHHKGEAEQDLLDTANEVVLQITRAYLTLAANADQIALERERTALAREALLLAQERYRLGLSPIVEVVRATTQLFEAESHLAEARHIYKISEAAVAYATGQDYKRY